jgi:hypothetical protein
MTCVQVSQQEQERTRSANGEHLEYLDITALGRQEEREDSLEGYPQTPPYEWCNWHDEYGNNQLRAGCRIKLSTTDEAEDTGEAGLCEVILNLRVRPAENVGRSIPRVNSRLYWPMCCRR